MVSPQSSAQPPRSTPKGGLRAVVIGGGVAGLAACSAIAPHVASITLIEQDTDVNGTYELRVDR